jgi:hypothetical protein
MSNIDYYKYENYYAADQYTNDYNDFDGIFIDEDDGIENVVKHGSPIHQLNGINGAIMTYNLSKPENSPPLPTFPNMSYLPPQNSAKGLNIHFPMNSNNTRKSIPAEIPIEVHKKSHTQKDHFSPITHLHNRRSNDRLPNNRPPNAINPPIAHPHFAGYVTSDRAENANIFYATGWSEGPEEFNSASSIDNDKYIQQEGNNVQWLGANNELNKNKFTDVNTFANTNGNYMYNNGFILKVLLFIILIILVCILCAVVARKKKYYNPIYEDYYY